MITQLWPWVKAGRQFFLCWQWRLIYDECSESWYSGAKGRRIQVQPINCAPDPGIWSSFPTWRKYGVDFFQDLPLGIQHSMSLVFLNRLWQNAIERRGHLIKYLVHRKIKWKLMCLCSAGCYENTYHFFEITFFSCLIKVERTSIYWVPTRS